MKEDKIVLKYILYRNVRQWANNESKENTGKNVSDLHKLIIFYANFLLSRQRFSVLLLNFKFSK